MVVRQLCPTSARFATLSAVLVAIVAHWPGSAVRAEEGLKERLQPLIDAHKGKVAVAVRHLDTGVSFAHRENEPQPTASLIKFPVMIEAYRQAREQMLDLTKPVTLRDEDKVPGSGILTAHFSAGASFSVRDAIRMMIAFSDNTATNLVLDQIGLPATARYMEELECPNSKIHSKVFKRETSVFPERSKEFGLGSTTAAEMVKLLELLHQRKLVSPEASDAMKEHLLACDDKLKFPRLLPAGTKIAHKTGSVDAVRTDAGIIYSPAGPIALCVLTAENADKSWTNENAGDLLCAKIGRAVFDFFNPPKKEDEGKNQGEKAKGRNGELEIALADGPHFAISPLPLFALQEQDPESRDDASPLPPLQPRDSLTGLPFVSCRNYAVADLRTGKILAESNAEAVVDIASTTKIMTAYVILQLVREHPKLLDETLTFSERADQTSGSSSGLRTGDRLPLRELLYALMLPSGNDAATSLAEHCGRLCDPPAKKSGKSDNLTSFIAEMNRTAQRLGLADSKFVNPHGLPEKGHVSSARDLVKLTLAAHREPLFRTIVSARRHETEVAARDGSHRTVTWKTTNKLLAIEGYTGVKTGYTRAAGACLVSTAERRGEQMLVVCLGAPSATAAASDSRNLYRWAWQQRGQRE